MTDMPAILGGSPIFSERLPISKTTMPDFTAVEDSYRDVFSTGMITNGKYLAEYEDRMASYLGVDHAVAVSSATSGLLLMLKCLDLAGEVILPSFTFSVTGHVLAWNGLRPVYVDIDPGTCLIDHEQVEDAITRDTCAILGVHLWGNPCRADRLQDIADRHGLPLLFDAAQALARIHRRTGMDGVRTAEGGEGVTGAMIRARIWVDGRLAGGLQALLGAPMAAYSGCGERDGGIGHGKRRSRTGLARVCGDVGLAGESVADGCRQAGSGRARNRARARSNWASQGQRCGRCSVRWRAERVIRPAREKNRRRRVLVVTTCSPRPMRAVQRARLWAITCTASQAALAAKRPEGRWFNPTPCLRSRMAFSISAWRRWSASSSSISPSRSVMKP